MNWTQHNYKKIYAIEADTEIYLELKKFVNKHDYENVELFNVGVWNEKGVLSFDNNTEDPTSSSISTEGNIKIDVDSLDHLIANGKVDFIKMDIEGAELNALHGAENLIKQNKPILAVCVYHKADDLIKIPQYIKKLNEKYKLYLRKHKRFSSCELVLYAIP